MNEEKQEPKHNQNKYLKFVEKIQESAHNFNLENGIDAELSYQQALSIYLRSCQLVREGMLHPSQLSPKVLAKQIDKCYEQKNRRARA